MKCYTISIFPIIERDKQVDGLVEFSFVAVFLQQKVVDLSYFKTLLLIERFVGTRCLDLLVALHQCNFNPMQAKEWFDGCPPGYHCAE